MTQFTDRVSFSGPATFTGQTKLSAGTVDNAAVANGAAIEASKLINRVHAHHAQAGGTDVVTESVIKHIAANAGSVKSVRVRPATAPTGGDKQFTVNVQKAASGSGTWTSVLDSVITVDSSSVDNTNQDGTLVSDPSYAAGDSLRVVITASGSTGSQGQGVDVQLVMDEAGL